MEMEMISLPIFQFYCCKSFSHYVLNLSQSTSVALFRLTTLTLHERRLTYHVRDHQ